MLLTIDLTRPGATDLGFLLCKHPDRFQSFPLSFGAAHVFYPETGHDRCVACLMLDVDPIGLVRKGNHDGGMLAQYVNDRPYVASSFMSVAIAQVFGSALQGRCKELPELVKTPIPLSATIDVLPARGGERFLNAVFQPLGYEIDLVRHPLDDHFPEWGESPYFSLTIRKKTTLAELLTHLYVLIPVFDDRKHYFVGDDELEKLLLKGRGWLASHPEREEITRRYLRHRSSLTREALARLAEEDDPALDLEDAVHAADKAVEDIEKPLSLNDQRLGATLSALRGLNAKKVLDLGCAEGRLIRELIKDRQFEEIVGVDVSIRALEAATRKLHLDRVQANQAERVRLLHGSLMYRDRRFEGFDAAAVIEVVEHLDPPRLAAFERVLFAFARPRAVVLTTPNCEYNVIWESVGAERFRHPDHRFEWTRAEFGAWAEDVAARFGYAVKFLPVGEPDVKLGPPTQMAIFELK